MRKFLAEEQQVRHGWVNDVLGPSTALFSGNPSARNELAKLGLSPGSSATNANVLAASSDLFGDEKPRMPITAIGLAQYFIDEEMQHTRDVLPLPDLNIFSSTVAAMIEHHRLEMSVDEFRALHERGKHVKLPKSVQAIAREVDTITVTLGTNSDGTEFFVQKLPRRKSGVDAYCEVPDPYFLKPWLFEDHHDTRSAILAQYKKRAPRRRAARADGSAIDKDTLRRHQKRMLAASDQTGAIAHDRAANLQVQLWREENKCELRKRQKRRRALKKHEGNVRIHKADHERTLAKISDQNTGIVLYLDAIEKLALGNRPELIERDEDDCSDASRCDSENSLPQRHTLQDYNPDTSDSDPEVIAEVAEAAAEAQALAQSQAAALMPLVLAMEPAPKPWRARRRRRRRRKYVRHKLLADGTVVTTEYKVQRFKRDASRTLVGPEAKRQYVRHKEHILDVLRRSMPLEAGVGESNVEVHNRVGDSHAQFEPPLSLPWHDRAVSAAKMSDEEAEAKLGETLNIHDALMEVAKVPEEAEADQQQSSNGRRRRASTELESGVKKLLSQLVDENGATNTVALGDTRMFRVKPYQELARKMVMSSRKPSIEVMGETSTEMRDAVDVDIASKLLRPEFGLPTGPEDAEVLDKGEHAEDIAQTAEKMHGQEQAYEAERPRHLSHGDVNIPDLEEYVKSTGMDPDDLFGEIQHSDMQLWYRQCMGPSGWGVADLILNKTDALDDAFKLRVTRRISVIDRLINMEKMCIENFRNKSGHMSDALLRGGTRRDSKAKAKRARTRSTKAQIPDVDVQTPFLGDGCTKKYISEFLREPIADIGERPCVRGSDWCMGMLLPYIHMHPDTLDTTKPDLGCMLKEFYRPDEQRLIDAGHPRPETRRPCVMCVDHVTTFLYYQFHAMGISPSDSLARYHIILEGEGKGYTANQVLPDLTGENRSGTEMPIKVFRPHDYVPGVETVVLPGRSEDAPIRVKCYYEVTNMTLPHIGAPVTQRYLTSPKTSQDF